MADHPEKPRKGASLPDQELAELLLRIPADYRAQLRPLAKFLEGKRVTAATGGRSGYALSLEDGSTAIAFVSAGRLELKVITCAPSEAELALIRQDDAPDGSAPSEAPLPYASERCSIADEVAHCLYQPVTGIAVGEDCFSLCFPGGMELEAMFVPNARGQRALRVFWEQW
jgi:hypothetical protein